MSTPAPKAITLAITFCGIRSPYPSAAPSSSAEPATSPHSPASTTSAMATRLPAMDVDQRATGTPCEQR